MGLKAVFGLGNPGKRYKNTRHNVGFMVIDYYLTQEPKIKRARRVSIKANSMVYSSENLILVKPLTFTNRSGIAMKEIRQEFGLEMENCLVVYDDLDIDLGELKAKYEGGAGGHRGIQSIIETMGTNKIPRLKVGIGNKKVEGPDLVDFVLDEFTHQEKKILLAICKRALEAIQYFQNSGIFCVMNRIN